MHVYVLEAPHGVKIGRSANPTNRLRSLSTQGGFAPVRAWVSLPNDRAAVLERAAHSALAEFRAHGEWFDVEFDRAVKTVCTATEALTPEPIETDDVSLRIRQVLARNKNLSQRGIALACGISDAAVSQWVSGATQNIRPGNLFAAADYLGVNARWLATGTDHIPLTRERVGRVISILSGIRFDSSKAFSEAAGIDPGNMSRYLSGQQEIPLEKLRAIAGALGACVSDIYRAAEQGHSQ